MLAPIAKPWIIIFYLSPSHLVSSIMENGAEQRGYDRTLLTTNIKWKILPSDPQPVCFALYCECYFVITCCVQRNGCRDFWAAQWAHLTAWLLDVEMGVVWSVARWPITARHPITWPSNELLLASLSIISFIFASIWYIDPALLTMVLQFQAADCTTVKR